jgi:hypothetical protein
VSRSSWIKTYGGILAFSAVLLTIALLFPYPVRIVDALSAGQDPGFDIKISAWRVIFEPFLGLLLFYLRADQPLLEFTVLLIWIIFLLLITPVLSILFRKSGERPGIMLSAFLKGLKRIPLVFSIWGGLLLLIIFSDLPSNTIVNHDENTILVNTHCHSEYSHDGLISWRGLQKWHQRNQFDAFFITDHNHHAKTLEALRSQDRGNLPASPLILCGEEFSGSNHITLMGLTRNFRTRGLTDRQVIDSTHDDGGVAIVAHWFDGERKSIPWFLELKVDGFEIVNQAYGLQYDSRVFSKIAEACSTNGLIMYGAADYHGYGSACFVWNGFDIPGWHRMDLNGRRESLMYILRQKDMSRIRVLLYQDRKVFDRNLVLLSPIYTPVSYFRTLNLLQVLSWITWLFLIQYTCKSQPWLKKLYPMNTGSGRFLGAVAGLSSLYMVVWGLILLSKAGNLAGYNEIYTGYGRIILGAGTGLLVYTVLLGWFEVRARKKLKHSTSTI